MGIKPFAFGLARMDESEFAFATVKNKILIFLIFSLLFVAAIIVPIFNSPRCRYASFLETNGEIPTNADYGHQWPLAQHTTWWGKRLDAKTFWTNRTIWLDRSAEDEAHRHGREYPPIPYGNSKYLDLSDKDEGHTSGGPDSGPFITFYGSDREHVFWDQFQKTQPKPPEDLDREAEFAAKEFMNAAHLAKGGPDIEFWRNQARNEGKALNYPPEEFTDDAFFWTYVMILRREYERGINGGRIVNGIVPLMDWLPESKVDIKLITDPLNADQMKSANAWKVAYLQRLRKERVDESYIASYLKAWGLSETNILTNGR